MRSIALVIAMLALPATAFYVGMRKPHVGRACGAIACAEPEPTEATAVPITLTAEEEAALREVKIGLGNDGKYGTRDSRDPQTWVVVKEDYPVLASRNAADLRNALFDLKPTPMELMQYTPIGPFIVLSTIAILLNGVAPDKLGF